MDEDIDRQLANIAHRLRGDEDPGAGDGRGVPKELHPGNERYLKIPSQEEDEEMFPVRTYRRSSDGYNNMGERPGRPRMTVHDRSRVGSGWVGGCGSAFLS